MPLDGLKCEIIERFIDIEANIMEVWSVMKPALSFKAKLPSPTPLFLPLASYFF